MASMAEITQNMMSRDRSDQRLTTHLVGYFIGRH